MYHISDCKKYSRCPRFYALSLQKKEAWNPYVRMDEEITSLAAEKLHVKNAWRGHAGDDAAEALNAVGKYEWLIKARFEYRGLRVKVPFLHDCGKRGTDLYFLYAGLYPHTDDMAFYDDMVWVLNGNGIYPRHIRIIHLNEKYERHGDLDPEQLFAISDHFYNAKNRPSCAVEQEIRETMRPPLKLMAAMDKLPEGTIPEPQRTKYCSSRKKCEYYDQCFPDEGKANDSILYLTGCRQRYAMKNDGRLHLRDADPDRIEGQPMQYAQIMADRNGGRFADRMALHSWLSGIRFPVSFLDFEWERYAVPPYEGMKPYDVLPFEYSLHVLESDGTLHHAVYLNISDDRHDMASHLIREMPETGSIIAYNADGAEKLRLLEFADQFSDCRSKMLDFVSRLEDLQLLFVSGAFYDIAMHGQWTLKAVMNAFDSSLYSSLNIRQGMEAVYAWRHLDRHEKGNDPQKISDDLRKYCGMDSYAMTVIFRKLLEMDAAELK